MQVEYRIGYYDEYGEGIVYSTEDLFDANRMMNKIKPTWLTVRFDNNLFVHVNFEYGFIEINGEKIDLEIDENVLKKLRGKFRWINFRRNIVIATMGTRDKTHIMKYGIGWQATLDGKNYQRFVLIDENGNWELHKKR